LKKSTLLLTLSLFFIGIALWSNPGLGDKPGEKDGQEVNKEQEITFWSDMPAGELAQKLLSKMDYEQMLGQVFMFGYSGDRPDEDTLAWIRERGIAGIKVFGWNSKNLEVLARTVTSLQKEAQKSALKIPLLISTDQEGGWVRHIQGETSITAGNLALGATGRPFEAYETGYYIAKELAALGINMNFAPTVDIYSRIANTVIGPRAFSSDPMKTAILGSAYYHGMKDIGVIATAKHYPGHGATDIDSHGGLPRIRIDESTLWERELIPYRVLIKEGLPAIMSGHLSFPDIIEKNLPASLSSFFQQKLLRERLEFEGVLVTDDLYMQGVMQWSKSIEAICKKALNVGNDIILLSESPKTNGEIWKTLYSAMQEDTAFRERIRESVYRILKLKLNYLKGEKTVPLYPVETNGYASIPSKEAEQFFFNTACRSVTVIRDKHIPFAPKKNEKLLLAGQLQLFFDEGKKAYPEADTFYFPYSPFYYYRQQDLRRLRNKAADYDTVMYCLANPNSAQILSQLKNLNVNLIVFSTLNPGYILKEPWVESALAVYGYGDESFKAGFGVLKGEIEARGSLPIQLSQTTGNTGGE